MVRYISKSDFHLDFKSALRQVPTKQVTKLFFSFPVQY